MKIISSQSSLFFLYKTGIVGLVLFFCSPILMAQNEVVVEQLDQYGTRLEKKLDSLKSLTFKDKYDEIENIRNIIRIYRDLDNDSALVYSNKEQQIAKELGDIAEIAIARLNAANLFNQMGEFERAKNVLFHNIKDQNRINDKLMARTRLALSNIFISTGEYDESITAGLAAAETFEHLKDSSNAGFSYISVAEIHALALDNEKEGIKYIKKAIVFLSAESAEKEYLIAALITYGDLCLLQEDYEKALNIYLQAKQIAVNFNEYWYYPDIMAKLGEVYYFKKEYETSITYLEQAGNRLESNGTSEALRYEYLGLNYRELNQPEKAISYFNLCLELENAPRRINYYREYLIPCYIQISDYETAFKIQQEITAYNDAVNQSKQKEKVTEIIEKYDNEKKQEQIKALNAEKELQENRINQQQLILYGIIGFFLILMIIGFFWYRTRMKLKETTQNLESAELQQRFLRTQLNPHFFFHALTSIESYIYKNDKNQAASFLRSFSKLMRSILEFSDVNFISLKQDVDFIKKYIELQRLSHDFQFDAQISISEEIDLMSVYVPPMLIQPAVENAILHGALKTENGRISIHYALKGSQVEIRINDNGKSKVQKSSSSGQLNRSMSTDITVKRIKTIKAVNGIDILYTSNLELDHSEGATVVFAIPADFKP